MPVRSHFELLLPAIFACGLGGPFGNTAPLPPHDARVQDPAIRECSGIAASRSQPGVFWVHNDSGNPAEIFAIDGGGKTLGRWPVAATNRDWEDIAIGPDGIYIGEIGNNSLKLEDPSVLLVDEPRIGDGPTTLTVRREWPLRYPDDAFNCEGLFVHDGFGYLVEKTELGAADIYRFSLEAGGAQALERVATLPFPAIICGADFDPESGRLALQHLAGLIVISTGADPAAVEKAPRNEVIWPAHSFEACCFAGDGVLAVSEGRAMRYWSAAQIAANTREIPERPRIRIHRASQSIHRDGTVETGPNREWPDRFRVADVGESGARNSAPLGKEGAKAGIWIAWTDEGLWCAGAIPDPAPTVRREAWFTGDCVEFFIGHDAPMRSGAYEPGDDRCYMAFDRIEDGVQDAKLFWPRRPHETPAGALCAARRSPDSIGYTFEAFVPWPEGRPAPSAGGTIRFALSALSNNPRQNWFVGASNNEGGWANPLLWAVGELAE